MVTGHVQDLWMRPGPNGRKVRTERYGKGKRWQARWQQEGKERAKVFPSKDAAEQWIAMVEVHGPIRPRPRITFDEYAPAAQEPPTPPTRGPFGPSRRVPLRVPLASSPVGRALRATARRSSLVQHRKQSGAPES